MSLGSLSKGQAAPFSARRPLWAVLLVLLAVLAVSIGSMLISEPYDFDRIVFLQLAAIVGLGSLLFLLQWPQAGLAILLVGAILVKFEIGTGTQSALNAAVLLAPLLIGVWLFHHVFGRERQGTVRSRTTLPLYLFMITAVLALMVGQYPWFPVPPAPMAAQLGQLAIFLFSGGLFLAVAHQHQDQRWLKRITYFFVGLGSVHLLARLSPGPLAGLSGALPEAVGGGSMFWTWLVAMSFGQALMNRDMNPASRWAMGGLALVAIGIGLGQMTAWMSGWLPAVFSVIVLLFLRFPVQTLAAAPPMLALAWLGKSQFVGLATAGDNPYSYSTRLAALNSLLPLLSANPLLGLGPANYYHYTILYPILGWYVKFNSHNNYLDLIGQTGLLGLAFFLWFVLAVGMTAWKIRLRVTTGFELGYVYSVLAGLLATLLAAGIGDWVLPFVYNTGFAGFRASVLPWIFMGGLVALEQGLTRTS